MRRMLFFAVWIGICCSAVPVGAAVDFRTGVNRDTITIGDPVVFRMRITRDPKDRVWLSKGDAFPDPFEVRKTHAPDVKKLDNGRVQETRDLTLTIYQVGAVDVPSVGLHYVTAEGDSGAIQSQPIPVFVRSVKPEGLKDILDVRPPVGIQGRTPFWAWLVLGGLALLIAGGIWLWRRRRRKPKLAPPPPPTDWEAEIRKIGRLGLLERRDYRGYYSLLSDVLRRCMEAKTAVRAVERTTFEIRRDLVASGAEADLVQQIERVLSEADMVKFAKYTPSEPAAHEVMDAAIEIVRVLVRPREPEVAAMPEGMSR